MPTPLKYDYLLDPTTLSYVVHELLWVGFDPTISSEAQFKLYARRISVSGRPLSERELRTIWREAKRQGLTPNT